MSMLHAILIGVSRVFLFVRCGVRVMVFDRSLKTNPSFVSRYAEKQFVGLIERCRQVRASVVQGGQSAARCGMTNPALGVQVKPLGGERKVKKKTFGECKRGRKSNLEFGSSGELQHIHQKVR